MCQHGQPLIDLLCDQIGTLDIVKTDCQTRLVRSICRGAPQRLIDLQRWISGRCSARNRRSHAAGCSGLLHADKLACFGSIGPHKVALPAVAADKPLIAQSSHAPFEPRSWLRPQRAADLTRSKHLCGGRWHQYEQG
jgi:hypothetical protein